MYNIYLFLILLTLSSCNRSIADENLNFDKRRNTKEVSAFNVVIESNYNCDFSILFESLKNYKPEYILGELVEVVKFKSQEVKCLQDYSLNNKHLKSEDDTPSKGKVIRVKTKEHPSGVNLSYRIFKSDKAIIIIRNFKDYDKAKSYNDMLSNFKYMFGGCRSQVYSQSEYKKYIITNSLDI